MKRARVLTLAGIAILGLLALGWGVRARRGGAAAAEDAAGIVRAALDAEARGDAAAAFALYDEGAARFPADPYVLGSYAAALNNRSYAVRLNRGRLVPVRSTSHRRVADACTALRLLDAAGEADPRLAAPALFRGRLYAAWGFPEDALDEFVSAYALGDRSGELDRTATGIARLQLAEGANGAPRDQKGRPASR